MKTIYLNQAIISYVEFMRKVIDMKKNPNDNTKILYHDFINLYRKMKNDEEIKAAVKDVRSFTCIEPDLIKIYYVNMPQLWAFIHLVLELKMKKELSLSFNSYKKEDFESIKKALQGMWFVKKNMSSNSYIYLEDDEHKVDAEIKTLHMKMILEQCKENIEKSFNDFNAINFKMDELRNRIA